MCSLESLQRVDVVTLVDHGDVETLPAHTGDEVVVLPDIETDCENSPPTVHLSPAVLHTAWVVQLPLGPLAVHGLEVLQGGAGVVLVQLPGLQVALVPLHVGPPVSDYAVDLERLYTGRVTQHSGLEDKQLPVGGVRVVMFRSSVNIRTYLAAGTGALRQAPLLTGRPVTLLVLRGPRDVPLHEGRGASLGFRADLRVDLLDGGVINDDDAVNNNDNHYDTEHQREKHS